MPKLEGREPTLFVKEVDTDLLCAICMGVMVNPYDTVCNHTFCYGCLNEALKLKESCAECRTKLSQSDIKPTNFRFKSMLSKLHTYCDNRKLESGNSSASLKVCEWSGEWGNLQSHLENECSLTVIKCKFSCEKSIQRYLLVEHEEVCEYRPTSCIYCKKALLIKDVNQHTLECELCPIVCSCGSSVLPDRIKEHEKNECLNREVSCRFIRFGCSKSVKFKDWKTHIEQDKGKHLLLLAIKLEEIQESEQNLKKEVQTLKDALLIKEINEKKMANQITTLHLNLQSLMNSQRPPGFIIANANVNNNGNNAPNIPQPHPTDPTQPMQGIPLQQAQLSFNVQIPNQIPNNNNTTTTSQTSPSEQNSNTQPNTFTPIMVPMPPFPNFKQFAIPQTIQVNGPPQAYQQQQQQQQRQPQPQPQTQTHAQQQSNSENLANSMQGMNINPQNPGQHPMVSQPIFFPFPVVPQPMPPPPAETLKNSLGNRAARRKKGGK
eukprot:TRINITY_DN7754_c0_g3_i1.p1 TRINITY_DN7754_c0_g3~~TRINITY_DN7754_c0_g3_i1.p1  ORF type:complete len:491 (-),score=120.49 TRINITY_DN7754_c0_g3_i1:150-1622(-)